MIRALALLVLLPLAAAAEERLSGYDTMGPALRAMQDDPFANPGLLWVAEGAALWEAPAGPWGRACATCHGNAGATMRGVAARYPAWDEEAGAPVDLAGRANLCRTRHQRAAPLPREGRAMMALLAFVARQSDGLPVVPDPDPRLDSWRERGEALFRSRMGQLALSCADCHDDHAGARLGAATIPQGHPTGYPQYRLEWEEMGPLSRRLLSCTSGVRAEPLAPDEALAIELYLMGRAAGMAVEAPAVRP